MAITRITSRQQLADYCLRKLGAPVLQINVDDEQLEDRIDDALDLFWEYHADGSVRSWLKHALTQGDLNAGYIQVPEGVLSVLRILPPDNSLSTNNLQYQMFITEVMDARNFISGGMSTYVSTQSYINLLNDIFATEKPIRFQKHRNQLRWDTQFKSVMPGDFLVYECYTIQDPEEFGETYNNYWLKSYTAALIKRQWGQNLIKFGNAQLPGGITMPGADLLSAAEAEITNLEERLRNEFAEPPDFFVG